jgi:insertion element IS1 protein InsB
VYLYSKKEQKCWVWLAVDRAKRTILTVRLGTRGLKNAWELIRRLPPSALFFTDYWQVYPVVLAGCRHIQGKAHTYTVESKNGQLRHYLARLKRRTLCYSKSIHMLALSLLLLNEKLNTSI